MNKSFRIIFIITIIILIVLGSYFMFFKVDDSYMNGHNIIKNATLDDIKKVDNKVNVYLFWGDGCPHCEELLDFLTRVNNKYGKYYNLYGFEVWYSDLNGKLMEDFVKAMGDETHSIPYLIIGDETFIGFNESYGDEIIDAIKRQYKSSYDVYFEKIK